MANDAVDDNLNKSAHFKSNMHFIGTFLIPLYVLLDISSRFIHNAISYHSESTRRAALDAAQLLTMTTLQERSERESDVTSFAFTWNGTKQTAILMPSHRRMTSVPCAGAGAFSSFHFHLLFAFQFVGHIHRSHTVTHMPLTAFDSNEQLKDFHRFQLELPSKHNTQQMEFAWNSRKLFRVIIRHSFAQIIHVNDCFVVSVAAGFAFHADSATFYKIIADDFNEREICELSEIQMFPKPEQYMMSIVQRGSPLRKMITYG